VQLSIIFVCAISGEEISVLCQFCECEAPPVTLRRFGLWAATPTEPRVAYTIDILQWAEALMLTSHVSLSSFLEAIRFRSGKMSIEVYIAMSFYNSV